jgi:hypothetical protein
MQKQTDESNLVRAVGDFLSVRGYVFWRQNTVGVYDVAQKRFRAMPKYAITGVSDYIVLIKCKAYFLELKSQKGVLSESQKLFRDMVERSGCEYSVIKSLDDLLTLGF